MGAEQDVMSRAKWLYAANAGDSVDDMKKYVKQAINETNLQDTLKDIYTLYDITYEDYVEELAKIILEIM